MIKRCIEVSGGPTHLALRDRQLVLSREGSQLATIPIEDLGVLVVDHPACTYTHGALVALTEHNVAVVISGANHHPAGLLAPFEGHSTQGEAIAAQASASKAARERLWREIVRGKITAQAAVLERIGAEAGGLRELARRVKPGDPDNLEAQAAQRYWRHAMGEGFRRSRDGDPPNNLLNYGYTVLRAATARAVCGAGLSPSLGIHHRNRYNAFALADDLMEPLRPTVDFAVRGLWNGGTVALEKETRAALIEVLATPVIWKEEKSPLMVAMQRYAASVREVLAGEIKHPIIPQPLPSGEEP
jgi:CRISPR-associated protein Cas1